MSRCRPWTHPRTARARTSAPAAPSHLEQAIFRGVEVNRRPVRDGAAPAVKIESAEGQIAAHLSRSQEPARALMTYPNRVTTWYETEPCRFAVASLAIEIERDHI